MTTLCPEDDSHEAAHHDVGPLELVAYRLNPSAPTLIPAPTRREWMDRTVDRFAARCLPMMIANQAGWFILNPIAVRLQWNGQSGADALSIEYERKPPGALPVVSYFGHGIVTWRIPWLFRTGPDFDLWVRGPANWPKRDAYPLEGIVETNWSVATFTMNWQLLSPDIPVIFDESDPIAMISPQRKADLERFVPYSVPIDANPTLRDAYKAWSEDRLRFIEEREAGAWQKDYTQGRAANDVTAEGHRTRLNLRPFTEQGAIR